MQYQECLRSFARHGASTDIIQLVATFLSDRKMSVRVGEAWSTPRDVNGGVPQGSILGVLLFNLTTDNLEDTVDPVGIGSGPVRHHPRHTQTPVRDRDGFTDYEPTQSTPSNSESMVFDPGISPFLSLIHI